MIRQAVYEDIPALTSLYNGIIAEGGFTGNLTPVSIESRTAWFEKYKDKYAIFVKEINDQIVGYLTLSPYREGREAFNEVSEISYFLANDFRGKGLGKTLLEFGMRYAKEVEFRIIVAFLWAQNTRSYALLKQFGFCESGRIMQAGKVQNAYLDHVVMSCYLGT
ncbi:MAG: N-acetyltransferase family protein [Pseudomonadota bacterium]